MSSNNAIATMTPAIDADVAKAFTEFCDVIQCPNVDTETLMNEYNKVAAFYDQVKALNDSNSNH